MSEETEVTSSPPNQARQQSTDRYLAFTLSAEPFALPLLQVKEVIAMAKVTPVPQAPPHFKGIINLRGQVISVIDLRMKLRLSGAEIGAETSIIILDAGNLSLGVIVDSVDSVLALSSADLSPPPQISSVNQGYLTGVARRDQKLILILDICATLDVQDLSALKQQQAA